MGLALIAAPVSAGDELSRRDTAALIKALASPDFDHRERAERELLQRGPGVEDACRAALRSASDIEQRLRLERVVERLPLATVLGVDPALALVEKPTLDGVFEALPKLSGVAIGERSGRELAENLLQALQWPEKLRTHLLDQRKLFDLCSRVVRGRATGLGWILVVLLEHEAFLQDDLVVEALGRLPGGAFRGILEQVLVGGDGDLEWLAFLGLRRDRDWPEAALIRALGHDSARIRELAGAELEWRRTARGRAALEAALKVEPDASVQRAWREALERWSRGGEPVTPVALEVEVATEAGELGPERLWSDRGLAGMARARGFTIPAGSEFGQAGRDCLVLPLPRDRTLEDRRVLVGPREVRVALRYQPRVGSLLPEPPAGPRLLLMIIDRGAQDVTIIEWGEATDAAADPPAGRPVILGPKPRLY